MKTPIQKEEWTGYNTIRQNRLQQKGYDQRLRRIFHKDKGQLIKKTQ